MTTARALVQLQNFDFSFAAEATLRDINVDIRSGEKVALVGPSGAGKSTLLMVLYGQLHQQAALCPQQLGLVDALSAYHNIYMGQLERFSALYNLWNLVVPIRRHKQAIGELAMGLGLDSLLFKPASQLSGGERQRVAVARALYRRQPVFIGDEPVSSLDPRQGQQVLTTILANHQTAIVALHDPSLALACFDRVIGVRNGTIALDQPSHQLNSEQLNRFYLEH